MSLLARSARRLFAAPAAQSYKDKLLLTLGSPTDSLYNRTPVDSVQLPGAEGTFTVTNLHSMVVSQLKAGARGAGVFSHRHMAQYALGRR